MKTNFDGKILSFEMDDYREKIFAVLGTVYGHGDSFVMLMTEQELNDCDWYCEEDWSKKLSELGIGHRSTYNFVMAKGMHNQIIRMA